jgi:Icc-related predicted phosphoesterase
MRITVISDTHTKHNQITSSLPGGDLLIHTGDIMNSGYHANDIYSFCEWFNGIDNYHHKVFIAGNHDRMFEDHPEKVMEILNSYKWIDYLQDDWIKVSDIEQMVKIYGSPWQPEFYDWAFNLPKGGSELEAKWEAIPKDTDILITHGPPQDHLDVSGPPYSQPHLGCALLREKLDEQPPKIHVFGHIHGGYGYKFHNGTHFFNASVLNEAYEQVNNPITFDWNSETNEIEFI